MKFPLLTTLLLLHGIVLYSQPLSQGSSFPADCQSDFWTITADGYIQQWSLHNGTISGGDTILSGGGTSLAYCGSADAPRFYTNNPTLLGISYYEADSGWVDIPTSFYVDHGGGHLDDQYYRVEGAVIQIVKYWDGTNLITLDSLMGEFFIGVQDIGVDTFGQAWIFTGASFGQTDSLKVYNQTDKVGAYGIHFPHIAYGSFFLRDTLYFGSVQDSIYPVILQDSTAELGEPIFFPSSNFTDMASCQQSGSATSVADLLPNRPVLIPNPTDGYLYLPADWERASITVYNAQGQHILSTVSAGQLDLRAQAPGLYFVRISSKNGTSMQKVLKR